MPAPIGFIFVIFFEDCKGEILMEAAVQETPCLSEMGRTWRFGKTHQLLRSIFKKLGILDIFLGENMLRKNLCSSWFSDVGCWWDVRSSTVQQDASLTPRARHKADSWDQMRVKWIEWMSKKDGSAPAFFANNIHSLKLTWPAPENGWLEDDPFLLGWPIFRVYVSFREGFNGNRMIICVVIEKILVQRSLDCEVWSPDGKEGMMSWCRKTKPNAY